MEDGQGEPDKRAPRSFPANTIHMVRTSQLMQLQLSQMADQKASMLMGATFVVFTLAVGQLRAGTMLLPIGILAVSAFASALFAILTVLPRVSRVDRTIGPQDNLLFFGIFTSLPQEEWIAQVLDRLDCDESTFRLMLRDSYQAGAVLQHKKYRFLGYAYRIFLVGMIMTALAAIAELAFGRLI